MTRRGIAFGLTTGLAALAVVTPSAAGAAGTAKATTPTPGCLPLTIRIDSGPPRHRRLPVAGGSCDRR